MNKWHIHCTFPCKAADTIRQTVAEFVDYPVVCNAESADGNVITLNIDPNLDGYHVVGKENTITITAKDEVHLLYAASYLRNTCIPYWKNPDARPSHYNVPFVDEMPPFELHETPTIQKRGIWTWGHVIYDYQKFIDNMVTLRLNTLIVWNDFVPLNIDAVIDYAHQNGVAIYLGFAWGWDQHCDEQLKNLDELPHQIAGKYKEEYAHLNCDGIYFQTFTELHVEEVGGITIADAAVTLVNETANLIYQQKPELDILFGLHATSVKTKLDVIAKTDKRITIMWEDLGAFPYAYCPSMVEGFDDTMTLQQTIRDTFDTFACVLKGVGSLDWLTFEHQTGRFVMGECSHDVLAERFAQKKDLLKYIQAHWMKNARYAHQMIRGLSENDMVTVLCEDCVFEECINFPMAVYAQMLWNPHRDTADILYEAALMTDVTMV